MGMINDADMMIWDVGQPLPLPFILSTSGPFLPFSPSFISTVYMDPENTDPTQVGVMAKVCEDSCALPLYGVAVAR